MSDLTVSGEDAAYHLPLSHAEKVDKVSLRVEVVQSPVVPALSGGIGNLSLDRWEDRWVAEAKLGRGVPTEDLQVRLPALPEHFTTVEKNATGEMFFCLSNRLSISGGSSTTWSPKRIAIAWDASGSRTDIERDLVFLKELFSVWTEVVVDLQVFRNRVEETSRSFAVGGGEADVL
ncbi:MAG: hypothetical protein GY731_15470, partial [Gammaproteobacteria bacterium]|nr:hypothetical protein [Gammaproteobacteria bacterium]